MCFVYATEMKVGIHQQFWCFAIKSVLKRHEKKGVYLYTCQS